MKPAINKQLNTLRQSIDKIDHQILTLITERLELSRDVLEVKIKAADGDMVIISDPKREQAIINRLKEKNTSPLPNDALEIIFQTLITTCRHLQEDSFNEQ